MVRTVLTLIAVCTVILTAHSSALAHKDLTPAETNAFIDANDRVIVVDVREPLEYCDDAVGHIPGALNYPWSSGVLAARYEELPSTEQHFNKTDTDGLSGRLMTILTMFWAFQLSQRLTWRTTGE